VFNPPPPRTRLLIRALSHPARARLHVHIHAAAEPVALADLSRAGDLAIAVARHHIRGLVACGLVEMDGEGRVRPVARE
jgi:DNA-binding transcriptional ArsR family regulator